MSASQLIFIWSQPPRDSSHRELLEFVGRIRKDLFRLRKLKALVDEAIMEDSLEITDEDLPF